MGEVTATQLLTAGLISLGITNLLQVKIPQRLTPVSDRLSDSKNGCIEIGHF